MTTIRAMLLSCSTLFVNPWLLGQNTIGLLAYDPELTTDGYMLFQPIEQGSIFLVNPCGQLVHEWPDDLYTTGAGFRFMDNGDIMRTAVATSNPAFVAGGSGHVVQRKDWSNNVVWQFAYSTPQVCMHHDIDVMPNGNVLIIAWEKKTLAEAISEGFDATSYAHNEIWPDHIIEVMPTGPNTGEIVWAWYAWDHLIQDHDPGLPNYGVVADHPELIDLNFIPVGIPDWQHFNAIYYDPELDLILLSSPFNNELWVIDHSTTTEEAAGHTGGNFGMGGDLLYRWGNPAAYGRGGQQDQTLFFNHNTRWLGPGLNEDDPDRGKIMVFNNRAGGGNNYSAVDIITPPMDENGGFILEEGAAFGPIQYDWRYATEVPTEFFSPIMSSAQKLRDGNVLVCASRQGWMFQITYSGEVVWSYRNPIINGIPQPQGIITTEEGWPFMAEWLEPDHPGLADKVLVPVGYLELDPVPLPPCDFPTQADGVPSVAGDLQILGNLVVDQIVIQSANETPYRIFNALGGMVRSGTLGTGRTTLGLNGLSTGSYVLVEGNERPAMHRFHIVSQ